MLKNSFRFAFVNKCNSQSILNSLYSSRLFSVIASIDDKKLQESYGFLPRLYCISKLALKEGFKPFQKLVDCGISESLIDAAELKVDLENPLLKKYNFNIEEFKSGAKVAVEKIYNLGMSKDVCNSFAGQPHDPAIPEYLYENCDPRSMMLFYLSGGRLGHVTHNVTNFHIIEVNTHYLDLPEFLEDSYEKLPVLLELYSDDIQKHIDVHGKPPPYVPDKVLPHAKIYGELDKKHSEWILKNFPPKCIVAEVICNFKLSYAKGGITSYQFATFCTVLSKNKELEWKLLSI